MAKMTFDPEHEVVLHKMMANLSQAQAGKMFGMPVYKVNGKSAVGLFEGGITFKVGSARMAELIKVDGIETFEPTPGRVWKDWVIIRNNFEAHEGVFKEAVDYVFKETS